MDPTDVFSKFDFPTAMVIILIMAVGGLFFLLWRSAEKREAQLQTDLKEARANFISALKDQNINTMVIANALAPLKASTDLIPEVVSTQKKALDDIGHIVDLVSERDTTQTRRRGDPRR